MNKVHGKTISWSATVHNKKLSSQCNFTPQIKPVYDTTHLQSFVEVDMSFYGPKKLILTEVKVKVKASRYGF